MIDISVKKVLSIDLENKEVAVKSFSDLNKYFGGTGLGLKLLEIYKDKNPLIFSVGPLNGFFPYASKTSVVLEKDGAVEDIYIGGSLSTRMKFSGIDSIILFGVSQEEVILDIQDSAVNFKDKDTDPALLGLPGKKSGIYFEGDKLMCDQYFTTPELYLESIFKEKNIKGITITGTEIFSPKNFDDYKKLYSEILDRKPDIRVDSAEYPSCSGCPMGCGKSKVGEIGGNILLNSLVACQFADKIYTDIGVVFSCLNTLGYEYTHEDIENLPKLIEDTIRNISK